MEALSPTMASTGSIGITRPMKKVTQVRPRKVRRTDQSKRQTRRTGPATRRAHSPSVTAAGAATITMGELSLRDRTIAIDVLEEPGLEAFHIRTRLDLVRVLEHDHERARVRNRLLQGRVLGLALFGIDFLGGRQRLLGELGNIPMRSPGERLDLRRVAVVVVMREGVGVAVRVEIVRRPAVQHHLVLAGAEGLQLLLELDLDELELDAGLTHGLLHRLGDIGPWRQIRCGEL